MIRILIVDDYPIVREGLVSVFESQPDCEIVGAAETAEDAIPLAERFKPDVALLDLALPGMSGLDAIPILLGLSPETRILVFTAFDSDEQVMRVMKAGAKGYLYKGRTSNNEVIRAVRAVSEGESFYEPSVADRLSARIAGKHPPSLLSEREMEALRCVAEGMPNKRIAEEMGITERTVKFHLSSVFCKLKAENRAQAVAFAVQRGLL